MARVQRKYLPWIIAGCVVLAIATWLVIRATRAPTHEVMFLLKFSEPVRPSGVTQDEIDAVLGSGYTLTFSDAYGSPEKKDVVKIVGLQGPGNMQGPGNLQGPGNTSDAEIAARLERLQHVKSVEIMTRKH